LTLPIPDDIAITRWGVDPWAQGAYTTLPVGASPRDIDAFRQPVLPWLYLAGEGSSPTRFGYVDGAWMSGAAAARMLDAQAAQGNLPAGAAPVVPGVSIYPFTGGSFSFGPPAAGPAAITIGDCDENPHWPFTQVRKNDNDPCVCPPYIAGCHPPEYVAQRFVKAFLEQLAHPECVPAAAKPSASSSSPPTPPSDSQIIADLGSGIPATLKLSSSSLITGIPDVPFFQPSSVPIPVYSSSSDPLASLDFTKPSSIALPSSANPGPSALSTAAAAFREEHSHRRHHHRRHHVGQRQGQEEDVLSPGGDPPQASFRKRRHAKHGRRHHGRPY